MRVLRAGASALEREFPFGVAIQLFEETWFAAGAGERANLMEGPSRPAGELLSGTAPAAPGLGRERIYAISHGLFWLARSLASDGTGAISSRPLALLVDDVDCADGPSLRFLAYMVSRIGRLPIAVVVAGEPEAPSADPPALSALRSAAEIVGPAPAGATRGAPPEGPRTAAAHTALRKSPRRRSPRVGPRPG